jgi:hypothetical protein
MLAAALTVVVVLSGCSVVKSAVSAVTPGEKPTTGDCWSAKPHDLFYETTWTGAPVPCTARHDAFTYSIVDLTFYAFTGSWLEPGTSNTPRQTIADDVTRTCSFSQDYVLPNLDDDLDGKLSRFAFTFHLPTVTAWEHGARWARCDVSLYAFGTTQWEPGFEKLPADIFGLSKKIESEPEKFQFCLDTDQQPTAESDPFADVQARYADCSGDPQWREVKNDYLADDPSAPYPGDEVIEEFERQTCAGTADATEIGISYGPTKKDWPDDVREVECWVGTLSLPQA